MFSDNHLHRYWISGTKSLKIFHLFSLDVAVNVFLQISKLPSSNEGFLKIVIVSFNKRFCWFGRQHWSSLDSIYILILRSF